VKERKAEIKERMKAITDKMGDSLAFWLLTKEETMELMVLFNELSEIERGEERTP
jgi:hypothetical protein